ncbi:MAG TPA: ferric reductase-like transmembrane domain-containing protein [Solirubrobacteraceae bacterium]|nr:ferric reductase-like transmembrane domain-containing protein [Solirubrobacteraceae bacterium]
MSPAFAATLGPSWYWYLARATGVVALVLLTASVVLGILGSVRFAAAPRWPRFAVDAVHRDLSLLVIVVLAIHIVTSVLDGFAPITLLDGVIPFVTPYRPLWMGLGTLAFDLLLAIAITSLIRRRLGYRTWRAVHWLAYASWPVAVLHGLGTGSDVKQWWMLALTVVCVMSVLVAVWTRIAHVPGEHAGMRVPATGLAVITPIGLAIFALAGPLQSGWARRAGTPASLLTPHVAASPTASPPPSVPASPSGSNPLDSSFSSTLSGNLNESATPGGAIVTLALQVNGRVHGQLRLRLGGIPVGGGGGGLSMTGSQVDFAAAGAPSALQGRVVELQGSDFVARVSDAEGTILDLRGQLQIDNSNNAVTGTLSGAPAGSTG